MARLTRAIFAAGLAVWLAVVVIALWRDAPLGHDEARYATDTREVLIQHTSKRYLYVPIGMNAMAAPGILLGGSERALRAIAIVAGFAFLLAAWGLARRVTTETTAAWVVAVLAGALPITKYSADLLSDLPAAACLLAAITVLIPEMEREDGPGPRTMLAAPLMAGAFYLRYGSAPTIVVIGLVAIVFGIRGVLRRPRYVIATVLALGALLVPFAVYSKLATGSMIGVVTHSAEVPGRSGGVGLIGYVAANPLTFYGILVGPLMVAGLVLALRIERRVRVLQIVAVLQIVVLGITTHAQARYIVVASVLLVIVGVDAVRRRFPAKLAPLAALAVVATWLVCLYTAALSPVRIAKSTTTVLAATTIRDDARGRECALLGWHTAQLEWYAGCISTTEILPENLSLAVPVYAVIEPEHDEALRDRLPGQKCALPVPAAAVEVVRLQPAGTACATPRP